VLPCIDIWLSDKNVNFHVKKIADIKGSIKKHQTHINVGKKSLSQPNKDKLIST